MQDLTYKIAQMLLIGFSGSRLEPGHELLEVLKSGIGGVILFDVDYQTKKPAKNIVDQAQVTALTRQLKELAESPVFIAVDYEGGAVNRLSHRYGFPELESPEHLAIQGNAALKIQSDLMAKTLKSCGFNLDFAPVLDVNIDPQNPIIGKLARSYSADPKRVAECAKIFVDAMHAQGILTCYKHFPGHGSSSSDSHLGFVDCTESWKPEELEPYRILLKNSAFSDFIMTAHVINRQLDPSGLPATLSRPVLSDLLRRELQFEGVIISDDLQMQAISDHFTPVEAATMTINAGADMLIYGNQLAKEPAHAFDLITMIEDQVKSGAISESRIEDAYRRVITLKKRLLS